MKHPLEDRIEELSLQVADLLAALQSLAMYVDSYPYASAWKGRPHAEMDAAREAIVKAKEKA